MLTSDPNEALMRNQYGRMQRRLFVAAAIAIALPAQGQVACNREFIQRNLDVIRFTRTGVRREPAALQRAVEHIDTLLRRLCVPSTPGPIQTVSIAFEYTTTTLWPGGQVGTFPSGMDSVVVCAAVQKGSTYYLGDPAITVRYHRPDSVSTAPRKLSTIGELRESCRAAWPHGALATTSTWPVTWTSRVVEPFAIPFPFAEPVIP